MCVYCACARVRSVCLYVCVCSPPPLDNPSVLECLRPCNLSVRQKERYNKHQALKNKYMLEPMHPREFLSTVSMITTTTAVMNRSWVSFVRLTVVHFSCLSELHSRIMRGLRLTVCYLKCCLLLTALCQLVSEINGIVNQCCEWAMINSERLWKTTMSSDQSLLVDVTWFWSLWGATKLAVFFRCNILLATANKRVKGGCRFQSTYSTSRTTFS